MAFDPFSRGLGEGSFDEILERFFGGDPFGRSVRSRPVDRVDLCTSCNPDRFFSHRRDRGLTGRQGVVARVAG